MIVRESFRAIVFYNNNNVMLYLNNKSLFQLLFNDITDLYLSKS